MKQSVRPKYHWVAYFGNCIVSSVTRLGSFLKPLATTNLSKSLTFLGNFCKGVKIYHFSIEIIFRQLLLTFGDFFLVTLIVSVFWEEGLLHNFYEVWIEVFVRWYNSYNECKITFATKWTLPAWLVKCKKHTLSILRGWQFLEIWHSPIIGIKKSLFVLYKQRFTCQHSEGWPPAGFKLGSLE